MPKIKDLEIISGNHTHKFPIYFSESEGFYVKGGVDKDMFERAKTVADFSQHQSLSYFSQKGFKDATFEGLKEMLQKLIDAFYESHKHTRRVILVSASFGQGVMRKKVFNPDAENSWERVSMPIRNEIYKNPRFDSSGGFQDDDHLRLEIEWFVADITVTNKTTIQGLVRQEGNEFKPDNRHNRKFSNMKYVSDRYIELPYTEEREQFFVSMTNSFIKMCDSIAEFIGKPEEEFIALVDQNKFALLPKQ